MESFTEKELLATINEMGYDLSPEELTFFKKEIDKFLDELERESIQQLQDENMSSNSLVRNVAEVSARDIPCCSDEEGLIYAEQYRHLLSYENLELRKSEGNIARSSTSTSHTEVLDHDEILNILDDGYRCLRQITVDNNRLQDLNSLLEESLRRTRAQSLSPEEDKQNFAPAQAITNVKEHRDETKSDSGHTDPAIRSVLHPVPGGVPFRHDPVKKYELYKRGWLKNPPPGEKKRLSLRWKVREFMLRRDISGVKPLDLARRRISNPEWSPRPYLD